METRPQEYSHINGWGIDANPGNDPTYPLKKRNNAEHAGYTWDRPTQQNLNAEVHHSIERPNISAVYGTAVEPGGLSGLLRRIAFSKSESAYGHWVTLLLADRVNVAEGILDDLSRGRVPNIYKEKGLQADWKYNRNSLIKKAALSAGIASLALIYLKKRKN